MTSLLSSSPHLLGLKLGGSDITHKDRSGDFPTTIDEILERGGDFIKFQHIEDIVKVLKTVLETQPGLNFILVHGVGPFGHTIAHKESPEVVHQSVLFLNHCVRTIFERQGIRTESLSPFDHCQVLEDRKRFMMEPLVERAVECLAEGRIPVGFGDMAPFEDDSGRYGVVSGDDILPAICAHPTVSMDRLVMLCKHQLYDRDPELNTEGSKHGFAEDRSISQEAPPPEPISLVPVNDTSIENYLKERKIKIVVDSGEKSEGMLGKVKACYNFTWLTQVPSSILPFDVLEQGLSGEPVGTRFVWED